MYNLPTTGVAGAFYFIIGIPIALIAGARILIKKLKNK